MIEPFRSLADAGVVPASGTRSRPMSAAQRMGDPTANVAAPARLARLEARGVGRPARRSRSRSPEQIQAQHERSQFEQKYRMDLYKLAPSYGASTQSATPSRMERRRSSVHVPPSPRTQAMRELSMRLGGMTAEELTSTVEQSAELRRIAAQVEQGRERTRPATASRIPASDQVLHDGAGSLRPKSASVPRRQPVVRERRKPALSSSRALRNDAFLSTVEMAAEQENAQQLADLARRSKPAAEAIALSLAKPRNSVVRSLGAEVGENPLLIDGETQRRIAAQVRALGAGSLSDSGEDDDDDESWDDDEAEEGWSSDYRSSSGRSRTDSDDGGDDRDDEPDADADADADADGGGGEGEGEARGGGGDEQARRASAAGGAAPAPAADGLGPPDGDEAVADAEVDWFAFYQLAAGQSMPASGTKDVMAAVAAARKAEVAEAHASAEDRQARRRRGETRRSIGRRMPTPDATPAQPRARPGSGRPGAPPMITRMATAGIAEEEEAEEGKARAPRSPAAGAAPSEPAAPPGLNLTLVAAGAAAEGSSSSAPPGSSRRASARKSDDGAPMTSARRRRASLVGGLTNLEKLGMAEIVRLRTLFEQADLDGSSTLDIDEFLRVFRHVLLGTSDESLREIFMKVDSNSDGSVSWDEFLSFMVLHNKALMDSRDAQARALPNMYLPPVLSTSATSRAHGTAVTHVLPLADAHKVLTASSDGVLALWEAYDLRLERSFANADFLPRADKARSPFVGSANDPWISTVLHAHERNTVMVGTADRHVLLYDCSSWEARRFVPYGRMQLSNEPTMMILAPRALPVAEVGGPAGMSKREWRTALVIGDARGDLAVFELVAFCMHASKLYPHTPIRQPKLSAAARLELVHSDWITCAAWIPSSEVSHFGGGGTLATGSLDRSIAITSLESGAVLHRLRGHTKSIQSIAYLGSIEALVSSGLDHDILLWPTNLGMSRKPQAVLRGHTSPVHKVLEVSGATQLLSLGSDGSVRLWDVRSLRCVQLLNDPTKTQLGDQRGSVEVSNLDVSCMGIDPRTNALLTAHTAPCVWASRLGSRQERSTHDHPVSLAIYNPQFDVVISADEMSTLAVWKAENGQLLGRFESAHGVSKVTSLAFDSTGRRLISGAHDGSVRVWNFSSGECLKACVSPASDAVEVTGVAHIPPTKSRSGLFVTVGWSKALCIYPDTPSQHKAISLFPDSREPSETVECSVRSQLHTEDITAIAVLQLPSSPQVLMVTAAYDGEVIVWELDSFADVDGKPGVRALRTLRPKLTAPVSADAALGKKSGIGELASQCLHRYASAPSGARRRSRDGGAAGAAGGAAGAAGVDEEDEDGSIERLLFLSAKPRMPLLSVGGDGCISAWDVFRGQCTARLPADHLEGEGLVGLVTDASNELVLTADTAGWVKVWEVEEHAWSSFEQPGASDASGRGAAGLHSLRRAASVHRLGAFGGGGAEPTKPNSVGTMALPPKSTAAERGRYLKQAFWWRAHRRGLVSVDLLSSRRMVVTACADGNVSLWSLKGENVGTFGRAKGWQIDARTSWRSLVPVEMDSTNRAWRAGKAIVVGRAGHHAASTFTGIAAAVAQSKHAPATQETADAVREAFAQASSAVQQYIGSSVQLKSQMEAEAAAAAAAASAGAPVSLAARAAPKPASQLQPAPPQPPPRQAAPTPPPAPLAATFGSMVSEHSSTSGAAAEQWGKVAASALSPAKGAGDRLSAAAGAASASAGAAASSASAARAGTRFRAHAPKRHARPKTIDDLFTPRRTPELEAAERSAMARDMAGFVDRSARWELQALRGSPERRRPAGANAVAARAAAAADGGAAAGAPAADGGAEPADAVTATAARPASARPPRPPRVSISEPANAEEAMVTSAATARAQRLRAEANAAAERAKDARRAARSKTPTNVTRMGVMLSAGTSSHGLQRDTHVFTTKLHTYDLDLASVEQTDTRVRAARQGGKHFSGRRSSSAHATILTRAGSHGWRDRAVARRRRVLDRMVTLGLPAHDTLPGSAEQSSSHVTSATPQVDASHVTAADSSAVANAARRAPLRRAPSPPPGGRGNNDW